MSKTKKQNMQNEGEQIFTSIPFPTLIKAIRSALNEEISEIIDHQKYEPLVKADEACKILGISKVTLLSWRKKGLVPFHKLNSRIYYKKSELLAALEQAPNRKGRRRS
ncbi:MAG: helix-turn-helix domain-containing protein [Bacteroidota bacterium]